LRLFEEAHILNRHEFGDGRSRYEKAICEHHHHLIDTYKGQIIEFHDERIEASRWKLQRAQVIILLVAVLNCMEFL